MLRLLRSTVRRAHRDGRARRDAGGRAAGGRAAPSLHSHVRILLALQESVLLPERHQDTASGVNPSCGCPFHASGLNILVQQVSSGLVLIQLRLLKCKLGHGGAGSFSCLYLQRKAGEGDQSEQPERRCSPAVSQDAKGKTYPSIPECQQRSPGNYLLRLLSYLMI